MKLFSIDSPANIPHVLQGSLVLFNDLSKLVWAEDADVQYLRLQHQLVRTWNLGSNLHIIDIYVFKQGLERVH